MPVATNAALKAVDTDAADAAGMELMFVNTYHMIAQGAVDAVKQAGGLHQFIGRQRPLITDSGGFQVFSLASPEQAVLSDSSSPAPGEPLPPPHSPLLPTPSLAEALEEVRELKSKRGGIRRHETGRVRVREEGVTFRSYKDGRELLLTPESSVDAQKALGADIIIPLDELPPYRVSPERLRASVARTHRWEERSLRRHLERPQNQAMYAVIHGGVDRTLRAESAAWLGALPFDGYAMGGSLGRDRSELLELLRDVVPHLPPRGPRHLLGIADLESIEAAAHLGFDTFDSCWPTRMGRHGTILTSDGPLTMKHAKWRTDYRKLDERVDGVVSQRYTRAYLHHLVRANEPLAGSIATLCNIEYTLHTCRQLREAILNGDV